MSNSYFPWGKLVEKVVDRIALGRMGEPEELAEVAAFLGTV